MEIVKIATIMLVQVMSIISIWEKNVAAVVFYQSWTMIIIYTLIKQDDQNQLKHMMQDSLCKYWRGWLVCSICEHEWEETVEIGLEDIRPGDEVYCPNCKNLSGQPVTYMGEE